MDFHQQAKAIEPELIELRRQLHANPELGTRLPWTSARMADELDRLGISYQRVGEDCLVGVLGRGGGRSIAIRADMDALPVREETGLAFSSTNANMHACGHDGHMTMGVGAAKLLRQVEKQLAGRVYLCFQSGEETSMGALSILDYLKAQGGVDQTVAIHLWADVASGTIALQPGPRMAGNANWRITVHGVGGHGSRPDLAVDPIKPAAAIVLAISAIPTNVISTLHPAVIHAGSFHAGATSNVFPPTAEIAGGYRFFNAGDDQRIQDAMRQRATGIAAAYGATAEVEFLRPLPVLVNDEAAVARAKRVVEQIEGLTACEFEQICASENYSQFTQQYPGVMGFLGVKREGVQQFYQHHPKYDIDESVLVLGAEFFARYAFEYLAGELD